AILILERLLLPSRKKDNPMQRIGSLTPIPSFGQDIRDLQFSANRRRWVMAAGLALFGGAVLAATQGSKHQTPDPMIAVEIKKIETMENGIFRSQLDRFSAVIEALKELGPEFKKPLEESLAYKQKLEKLAAQLKDTSAKRMSRGENVTVIL